MLMLLLIYFEINMPSYNVNLNFTIIVTVVNHFIIIITTFQIYSLSLSLSSEKDQFLKLYTELTNI